MSRLPALARVFPIACAIQLSIAGEVAAQCETAKIFASDAAADDWFGYSCSLSGTVLAAGSQFQSSQGTHAGRVYVYRRSGRIWVESSFTAADAAIGDLFGASVCLVGDRLLVGAPQDDHSSIPNAGSAYVFEYDGSRWVETQKLAASDAQADDAFGVSVALYGDIALVGALMAGDVLTGAAYVYRFDGTQWNEEVKLTASDSLSRDAFGYSVAVGMDLAVVGAYYSEGTLAGKAYVYRFDGTHWNEEQILVPSDAQMQNYFGLSVALAGDRLVVGAQGNGSFATRAGCAYVFHFDGSSWLEEARLVASDFAAFDFFGVAVAMQGDTVVVGAIAEDSAATNAGAVYRFVFDGTQWTERDKFTASDAAPIDELGRSVSIDGDLIVGGAFWADSPSRDSGAAYVFLASDDVASWTNTGTGWPGTLGDPTLTMSADPILGTQTALEIGNSLGAATSGFAFVGFQPTTLPTNSGGTLWLVPYLMLPLPLLQAPLASLSVNIPCNPNLAGAKVYLQAIEFDSGASDGVSFTPALEMNIGF